MTGERVPFPRSYWVIKDRLLAGCYPGGKTASEQESKLESLFRCGIRHVINLMEPHEVDHDGNPFTSYVKDLEVIARQHGTAITYTRTGIKDVTAPTHGVMRNILAEIDEAIARDRPVFIHCWGGRGRTGTVVGCYLMAHGLATSEKVLQMIAELRKNDPNSHLPSPETNEQRAMVLAWNNRR
jgi:hypothetical protein